MCLSSLMPASVRIFLHDLYKPGDVYACYRLLFLLTFIAAVVPFEFRSTPSRHLANTMLGYANSLLRIGFYLFIFGYSMTHGQSLLSHFFFSDVSKFTDNLQKFNGMFGILNVLIFSLWESKAFIKLMEQYEWLELRLSRIGIRFRQINCARKINLIILVISSTNVAFILYGCLVLFIGNGVFVSIVSSISFYSPHLVVSTIVIMFNAALHKLTQYFRAINKVNTDD